MNTRQEWALADQIGKILGITKYQAKAVLPKLKEANLVTGIECQSESAIAEAKKFLVVLKDQDKAADMAGALKLMLWAINKCESVDLAKQAFKRAIKALEA